MVWPREQRNWILRSKIWWWWCNVSPINWPLFSLTFLPTNTKRGQYTYMYLSNVMYDFVKTFWIPLPVCKNYNVIEDSIYSIDERSFWWRSLPFGYQRYWNHLINNILVLFQNDLVVDTTLVGVVLNGLSHLHNVKDKTEFCVSLIRGLGGNLSEKTRANFAKEVDFASYKTVQDELYTEFNLATWPKMVKLILLNASGYWFLIFNDITYNWIICKIDKWNFNCH